MRSSEDLTESQWTWLQCQLALDEGVLLCPQCQQPGIGAFCQQCGARMGSEDQHSYRCERCHLDGPGPFCIGCGTVLEDETVAALEEGSFDWEQWQRDMQPFVGPLSAREQALFQHQG